MRAPGPIPEGYVVHRIGNTWLVLDRELAQDLIRLHLADPGARRRLFARAPRRGRGAAPSASVRPGLDAVLRRYRHGGMLAPLLGSLYLGPGRALDELRISVEAHRAGAPVPRALCLVLWPRWGGLFWSALIGTREEPRARDLLEALSGAGRRDAVRLAGRTGEALRRLHDAGVDHPDLQLRNVLLADDGSGERVVVIDLDRARYHPGGGVPPRRRAANLGRLARSTVKCGLWGGAAGPRALAAFARAYTRGDRALRRELRARLARERLKIALHRLRYRFLRP